MNTVVSVLRTFNTWTRNRRVQRTSHLANVAEDGYPTVGVCDSRTYPSPDDKLLAWKHHHRARQREQDLVGELCKVIETGNLQEVQRLLLTDESKVRYRDDQDRTILHLAAAGNRVDIMEFIIARGADLNAQDKDGNTALHVAVENCSLEALNCLLQQGIDSSILNYDMKGAIHLATELNKPKVLEEMVKYKGKVDPRLRGKHGRTALHVAAIYDHAECTHILLKQLSCCPKIPCENGYYPIHEAAKNASANALKAILEWNEQFGTTKEDQMKLYDADGNVPLHSAVHAGDLKAVQLCLESGAIISTQQHDLSTPVHLACAQGAIEIVKLMFTSQPEQKHTCLEISDAQQMTPLHYAAMFDHPDLVEYLIKEGADMNVVDKEGRSVLLLATTKCARKSVKTLLCLGADITLHDKCNRNVLHHTVLSGGNLADIYSEVYKPSELNMLLNERDIFGCTTMHYASRKGNLKTIESLLRLGAIINLKNNENQSPLHFAARYGRYNTVRQLLDTKKGHLIINELDGEGMTPLHIASQNGHTRVVHLLLVKGALLHRDHKGRTPLHYSAINGYTHTIEHLLAVHSHLLDQVDRDGNTALHLAANYNRCNVATLLLTLNCAILRNNQDMTAVDCALHYKHSEVAMAMVTHETRSGELLKCRTKKFTCLLDALTAVMPEVMTAVLDKGVTRSNSSRDSKSYFIRYNFEYLQDTEKICSLKPVKRAPLPVMNLMVNYGREELMNHPLCVRYLETKWSSYGMYFHLLNLAIYSIFLIFVTTDAIRPVHLLTRDTIPALSQNQSGYSIDRSRYRVLTLPKQDSIGSITSVVVMAFAVMNVLKEFYQMYQQRHKYFLDVINLVEWILYISAGVMAAGHMFADFMDQRTVFITAAVAVFFAWFNYLLYLQRFNRIGIFVVMFLEILSTLLKVMFIFSVLIIAFGLSFFILLTTVEGLEDKGFFSPPISLVRVSTMMLGELDFLGTFLKPYRVLQPPSSYQMVAAIWFLVFFMILMPILLMNLLIGLAVGDIETVRRNAQMKRLTMQVQLHTDLERKIPRRLLKMVDKMEVYEYPNKKCVYSYLYTTLQRWFANPYEEGQDTEYSSKVCGEGERLTTESGRDLGLEKKRIKEIWRSVDQQLQMVRLIVQKMEIRTENDDMDEGEYEPERPQSAISRQLMSPDSRRRASMSPHQPTREGQEK